MRKQKNRILREVEVTGYAAEGKSLAKVDGKVVFIEGAVPGDIVDVHLGKSKKDWAEGKAVQIHHFSPDRVDPFCRHFGLCGGCKWQMLPYEKQLEYKENEVAQHLRRIGKVELPPMQKIIGADQTTYYRNKLEFTFSAKRYVSHAELSGKTREEADVLFNQPALGFHVPRIFDKVIDIRECYLQKEPGNRIRNEIRDFVLSSGFSFYDIRSHQGWLRNLMIRLCTTGEIMLNLVFGYDDPASAELLGEFILKRFPEITSLFYTINPKFNDSIYDLTPVLWRGKPFVTEKLGGLSFRIGPKSFFQTNTRQAEKLYSVTREFAELTGKETVYDLYCGTGSIGLFVSGLAKKVIGVETVAEAVSDARENAALNRIRNAEFFAGDVIDVCDDMFLAAHGNPDVVITDPPRSGMHPKLVEKIIETHAPLVVYVSCNPATQARDLALLDQAYRVTRIQPVDMFPHTHHIENVVQLKRRNL